jgi:hypothetical protein
MKVTKYAMPTIINMFSVQIENCLSSRFVITTEEKFWNKDYYHSNKWENDEFGFAIQRTIKEERKKHDMNKSYKDIGYLENLKTRVPRSYALRVDAEIRTLHVDHRRRRRM